MDILTLAQSKTQLRKTASTHGGEYVGPCPSCGGTDRFHVWPDKVDSKRSERVGIYWCRSCGKSGDVIQWFVDFEGMTHAQAFRAIGEEMPADGRHRYATPRIPGSSPAQPTRSPAPPAKEQPREQVSAWLERAAKLVEHAERNLAENAYAIGWLKKRGISKKTAAGMRLGWIAEDIYRPRSSWGLPQEKRDDGTDKRLWIPAGLVIPLLQASGPEAPPAVRRIRIRRFTDREPRYVVVPGSMMACMAHGLPNRAAVIVESELDAIMLAGIAADLSAVVAMGSATTKPGAHLLDELRRCAVVLVALDSDRAGAEAIRWWKENLPASKRWPVPTGKDPGEAFAAGVDVREWVQAGLPRGWFLGPSSIGLVVGKRDECGLSETKATASGPKLPSGETDAPSGETPSASRRGPVVELGQLLRTHPIEVRVARDGSRIFIRESQNWKRDHWETSKRISQLVFQDCEVLDYLLNHGAEIINGANFEKGVGDDH